MKHLKFITEKIHLHFHPPHNKIFHRMVLMRYSCNEGALASSAFNFIYAIN